MGEESHSVRAPAHGDNGRRDELATDIRQIRNELDTMVSELNRRTREALDVKAQVKRHPVAAWLMGAGVVIVVSGLIALKVIQRRQRAPSLVEKMRRLARGLSLMMEDPDRTAVPEPRIGTKILTAAGAASAAALAKQLVKRAVLPASTPR